MPAKEEQPGNRRGRVAAPEPASTAARRDTWREIAQNLHGNAPIPERTEGARAQEKAKERRKREKERAKAKEKEKP